MKYIFDFDDVLFDAERFKEHIFSLLEKAGVSRERAEDYYSTMKGNELFSLKIFINHVFAFEGVDKDQDKMYEEIMSACPRFANIKLIEWVKRVGPENCYIVTFGDDVFQREKIRRSGLDKFFSDNRVETVKESKRGGIEKICNRAENKGENFIFIDDKQHHFEDLRDVPNLTTWHYPDQFPDGIGKENISEPKRK